MRLRSVADVLARLDVLGVERVRLTVDSRSVQPGDVFVALRGSKSDGRRFIDAALQRGGAAVLRDHDEGGAESGDPRVIDVDGLAAALGTIADEFYDRPSLGLQVFGVTGTNGKTSIVSWIAQALQSLGTRCGAIGTLGVSLGDQAWPTNNTTPDAATVHTSLRDLKHAGAQAVAMEVSSHALELHRVSGVRFDTVVFTNLTQDHLDFHGSMAAYGAAKAKLFTDYTATHRVINADDPFGAELLRRDLPGMVSYGIEQGDVRGTILAMSGSGMRLRLNCATGAAEFETPLIGKFNAYNLLAVAAVLRCQGQSVERIAEILAGLVAAPGRMQRVRADAAHLPSIYVDYAHTPDALLKALDTVRETRPVALSVVFGCGGDRDSSKRPIMGRIAAERADIVYVTSDNPRSEAPDAIIADIVAGVEERFRGALRVQSDRRRAIRDAVTDAVVGGAVLIAGKGHEDYQEIAGERTKFSDVIEAQSALEAWRLAVGRRTEAGDQHVDR